MTIGLNIVIAPNEDGFGTSAWVVMLAKELSRHSSIAQVKIVIATKKREDFHSDKYRDDPNVVLTRLPGQPNRIEVPKNRGAVDVPGTIEQCILTYPQSRIEYAEAITSKNVIDDADVIVDFGVPHMARAAYGKRTATIFDHAWSMSLARIVSSDTPSAPIPQDVNNALEDMRNDEALTQQVILFGAPICPLDYHGYWKRLLGRTPKVIPGALGGPLCTLAYAHDPIYAAIRPSFVEKHVAQLSHAVFNLTTAYAKELLGITNDKPVLFVSGGGTAVWDDVLSGLVDTYEASPPSYNVVMFSPSEVARLGIKLTTETIVLNGTPRTIKRAKSERCDRITFIDTLEGETHHVLFAAFDLILTRAGGGTVNNALAFRVPLVLIEEPGMWQVEQIRRSCVTMGIAESFSLEDFRQQPRQCIETATGTLKDLAAQSQEMHNIPNHGEFWLCHELLAQAM